MIITLTVCAVVAFISSTYGAAQFGAFSFRKGNRAGFKDAGQAAAFYALCGFIFGFVLVALVFALGHPLVAAGIAIVSGFSVFTLLLFVQVLMDLCLILGRHVDRIRQRERERENAGK